MGREEVKSMDENTQEQAGIINNNRQFQCHNENCKEFTNIVRHNQMPPGTVIKVFCLECVQDLQKVEDVNLTVPSANRSALEEVRLAKAMWQFFCDNEDSRFTINTPLVYAHTEILRQLQDEQKQKRDEVMQILKDMEITLASKN